MEDVDEEVVIIYCDYSDFHNMQIKLEQLKVEIKNSDLQRIPNSIKRLTLKEAEKVLKLLDLLEENDDVQQVFHNMELTEEILSLMEKQKTI